MKEQDINHWYGNTEILEIPANMFSLRTQKSCLAWMAKLNLGQNLYKQWDELLRFCFVVEGYVQMLIYCLLAA